jgi:hypothetical protein
MTPELSASCRQSCCAAVWWGFRVDRLLVLNVAKVVVRQMEI